MRLSKRLLGLAILLSPAIFSACSEGGPDDPVGVDSPELAGTTQATMEATRSAASNDRLMGNADGLESFESAIDLLDVGQCLIEYGRANGKWTRYVRTLGNVGSGDPAPFAVDYRLKSGRIVYRGTCDVPLADHDRAMDAISWAPGNGRHAAGKGWRGDGSVGQPPSGTTLVSGVGTTAKSTLTDLDFTGSTASVNLDAYSHYDWCYVLMEGGEIVDVFYCGNDSDPDQCGDLVMDSLTGDCVDPGGAGSGSDGTSDDSDSEPLQPVLEEQYDETSAPLSAPDCADPTELTSVAKKWCESLPPDATYQPIIDAAASQVLQKCSYLQDAWTRAGPNIRVFTRTTEGFSGGAAIGGDWMILDTNWLDVDPEQILAHELLHVYGHQHGTDPNSHQWTDFYSNLLPSCH